MCGEIIKPKRTKDFCVFQSMGYYCTVPQCTSLAGKTKNVKFHRFPRDITMADKWNTILKRGKPYTKYSKVCSLHFTQSDYNVTTMGKNKGITLLFRLFHRIFACFYPLLTSGNFYNLRKRDCEEEAWCFRIKSSL